MDSINPYAAPAAVLTPEVVAVPHGTVGDAVVAELGASRQWLGIMGIAGILVCLTVIANSVLQLVGKDDAGIYFVVLVVAALYVAPAVALLRAAAAVKRLGSSPDATKLAEAVQRLAAFWRLAGLVTATTVGVSLLVNVFMHAFLRSV